MTVIIGVLQPADDRRGGPDPRGQLTLAETGLGPQPIDVAGDVCVGERTFVGGDPVGVVSYMTFVEMLQGVGPDSFLHPGLPPRLERMAIGIGFEPGHPRRRCEGPS